MLFELSVDVVGRCAMRHGIQRSRAGRARIAAPRRCPHCFPHVTCASTVRVGTMPSRAAADYADSVEPIVRKTAAWSWRLLVILTAVVAVLMVVQRLEVIVVPLLLALMLSALLVPIVDWLDRRGAPRGGAVALVILAGFAILGGILTFVVSQFIVGVPDLVNQVTRSIDSTKKWLIEGPLKLSRQQIDNAGNAAIQALQNNEAKLTSGALSTAATITEIVTAALLILFTLIFFLYG